MIVYRVVMAYYDGDHDHGQFESPLFLHKEHAEQFRAAVSTGPNKWVSSDEFAEPYLEELTILEEPQEPLNSRQYLLISYT